MANIAAMKAANVKRWQDAKLTRGPEFAKPANKALANKAAYLSIAKRAGMPDVGWLFIAVSHYRESSQDFTRNLGQGDPLNEITTHVPAGRGPFLGPKAFEDAAVDALVNCAPYAARLTDWSIGGMLTNLERYNGVGYASGPSTKHPDGTVTHYPPQPSPYIWAGTDQYVSGKYVRDGVYDAGTVDKQLGCAGLILAIMALDHSITFDVVPRVTPDLPPPAPAFDALWLQNSLNTLGAKPQLIADGINGPDTRTATRAFQTSKGLVADGLVGPVTIEAILTALKANNVTLPNIVLPKIDIPPPGQVKPGLAPTFWGRVMDLFKPKDLH